MESKTHRYVLRVVVQMLDNSIGDYQYDQSQHTKDLNKAGVDKSTGNHIAIFEC
jgi:hypothetical protein